MKKILLFSFMLTQFGTISAHEFRYAELVQIEYEDSNGNHGIMLGFNTDPGDPVKVMKDAGKKTVATKSAYNELFDRMGWGKAEDSDLLYILNVLGSRGWEVIHVSESDQLVTANHYPGKSKQFLLKKSFESANNAN